MACLIIRIVLECRYFWMDEGNGSADDGDSIETKLL